MSSVPPGVGIGAAHLLSARWQNKRLDTDDSVAREHRQPHVFFLGSQWGDQQLQPPVELRPAGPVELPEVVVVLLRRVLLLAISHPLVGLGMKGWAPDAMSVLTPRPGSDAPSR